MATKDRLVRRVGEMKTEEALKKSASHSVDWKTGSVENSILTTYNYFCNVFKILNVYKYISIETQKKIHNIK